MNKTDLAAAVAAKTGMTKKDAEKFVNVTIDTLMDALANGDKVQLVGFGTFETKTRAARVAKNPRTGEPVNVGETRVPAFKAGQALKNRIK
ncbi:MAG: HU family DNA-binding protein [Oscillospiraceae bacterium]|jgi:DNA-binding protein HU-beta|nr:HU family DNA-binding protein [Oscillospiraceae bacterium]MBQ6281213.1 HU family DNA-binding protein [Oscillospiraceae bacterium]MCR5552350.1 HU family DNA-binding protein [Oscillospiraceae bacterium]